MQYNVVLDPIEFDYTDKTFFTFLQFRFHWINAHLYFLAEEIPSQVWNNMWMTELTIFGWTNPLKN